MRPRHGRALVVAQQTAEGRTVPAPPAENRDRKKLVLVVLIRAIQAKGIRVAEAPPQHGVVKTAPQRVNAGRKGQQDRRITGPHGQILPTAPPEDAAASPIEQAGATADGAPNIFQCFP